MKSKKHIVAATENLSFRRLAWQRFRQNKAALWSFRLLFLLAFIAVFSPFLANEKPIYCKINGTTAFPVLKSIAINWGLTKGNADYFQKDWANEEYESVVWTPIPYSSTTIDRKNMNYVSPFGEQRIRSNRFRHILGTDDLGRDVAAGMIAGTRVAMLVGIIAMFIATLIGLFLGTLAGYFGDTDFRATRGGIIAVVSGLFFGGYFGFVPRSYALSEAKISGSFSFELLKSLGIAIVIFLLFYMLKYAFHKIPLLTKKVTVPIDFMVMRLIEIFRSIPGLLLLLAIVATIPRPSVYNVMIIIGFIAWPGITRYVRGEMLKIRELDYITAGKALGYSPWHIIMRHALPNAMGPVLIAIAFGVASSILLEATLSFLGIGVSVENVTWGSLLNEARSNFSAWWLAIFPGVAIFVTVMIFNLIGEGLQEGFDPRVK